MAGIILGVCFGAVYGRTPIEIGGDELIERVPDLRLPAGAAAALP